MLWRIKKFLRHYAAGSWYVDSETSLSTYGRGFTLGFWFVMTALCSYITICGLYELFSGGFHISVLLFPMLTSFLAVILGFANAYISDKSLKELYVFDKEVVDLGGEYKEDGSYVGYTTITEDILPQARLAYTIDNILSFVLVICLALLVVKFFPTLSIAI